MSQEYGLKLSKSLLVHMCLCMSLHVHSCNFLALAGPLKNLKARFYTSEHIELPDGEFYRHCSLRRLYNWAIVDV